MWLFLVKELPFMVFLLEQWVKRPLTLIALEGRFSDSRELYVKSLFENAYQEIIKRYPKFTGRALIHETICQIIGRLVIDLIQISQQNIAEANVTTLEVRQHSGELIAFSPEIAAASQELKRYLREKLYFLS